MKVFFSLLLCSVLAFAAIPNPYPASYAWSPFGDSITGGDPTYDYVHQVINGTDAMAGTSWSGTNYGIGGATAYNQGAQIYSNVTTSAGTLSSSFIGTNDTSSVQSSPNQTSWRHILEAEYVYLLTRTKVNGQSMSVTGTWANSSVNPSFGIVSSTNGSTATGTCVGTCCYVAFWASLNSTASIDITIDGVDQGQFVPATTYTDPQSLTTAPFLYRFTGLSNASHSAVVTITTANGHSTELDFIAGNANQLTGTGPTLFVLTPYQTLNETLSQLYNVVNGIRTVAAEMQSDGLGIQLVDVTDACFGFGVCYGGDGVHPPDRAHAAVIANALLSAIANQWQPNVVAF